MAIEFIPTDGSPDSISRAVSQFVSSPMPYVSQTQLERLTTENHRLRETVSLLIEALAGVLPNEVLQNLCGGHSRGSILRDGNPDLDVPPLADLGDTLDTLHQEIGLVNDRIDDHCWRRAAWAHDE